MSSWGVFRNAKAMCMRNLSFIFKRGVFFAGIAAVVTAGPLSNRVMAQEGQDARAVETLP